MIAFGQVQSHLMVLSACVFFSSLGPTKALGMELLYRNVLKARHVFINVCVFVYPESTFDDRCWFVYILVAFRLKKHAR